MTVWMVRAGRDGEREDTALEPDLDPVAGAGSVPPRKREVVTDAERPQIGTERRGRGDGRRQQSQERFEPR